MDQAPLVVEPVVPEPAVGTGSDLTVNIIPQTLSPASDQRQLAISSDRAQALTDSGFPLLATPEGVRNPGRSQDPEIPNKEAEIKELQRLCALFGYQTPGTSKDPEPTVNTVPSVTQFKFTEPRKLSQEWILEVTGKPNVIRVYIKLIFAHLTNIRAYRQGDPFPIQFLNYVSDSKLMESMHSFVEAEATLTGQTEEALIEKTVILIKRLLTGNSRDPAIVAKETLLSGKVSQGNVSVSQYIETFKSHARLIKDHTSPAVQEWLCTLFRGGITPSLAGQCALTDQGTEWETLDSLFQHAIKEETKLSAKDRVNLTANSPPFTVKRTSTVAALPAQLSNRPRLDKQRLAPQSRSSESYTIPNCPIKHSKWSAKVMAYCTEHKSCFKCRDRVHAQGHTECPFRLADKQAWGDYSPLHGPDPAMMQVDEPEGKWGSKSGNEQRVRFTLPPPPGQRQEPARGSNPYAPPKSTSYGKSTRGSPSASAHRKRFSG